MEAEKESVNPKFIVTKSPRGRKRGEKGARKVSFLDVMQTTLSTGLTGDQDIIDPNEFSSESEEDILEEEDIGEIAHQIASESVDEVSKVSKRVKKQLGQFNKTKNKVYMKYKSKIDDKANDPSTLRFVDKITYFIAVPMLVFDFWTLGRYPDDLTYYAHLFIVLGLVFWRHINYRYVGYHYYLVDFCYFGNYTLCLLLTLLSENKSVYCASFAYAVGPLGLATIMVGNSFVLHSIDKLTSIYIHLKPMITMTNLHWVTQHNKGRGWDLYDASEDTFSFEFFFYYVGNAFYYYAFWVVCYFLILFVIKRKSIKKNNYETLFIYFSNNDKGARKLWYSKGKKYAPFFFLLTHVVMFVILVCLSFLCYFSMYLNVFLMVLSLFASSWRGATFYMDYFCKQYEINLANIEEVYKEVKEKSQTKNKDNETGSQEKNGNTDHNGC